MIHRDSSEKIRGGKMKERTDNPNRIYSLDGIKAIAMVSLFWWHSSFPAPSIDLGARACEILFIISGFLVAANYYDRTFEVSCRSSIRYVAKKIVKFYPLHLVALGIMVLKQIISFGWGSLSISTLFAHVFLIQAWFPSEAVSMAFNGASWFLSALLFCYLLAFPLLRILKRTRFKICLPLLLLCLQIAADYLFGKMGGYINLHTFPIVRLLQFFIGMSLLPIYKQVSVWTRNLKQVHFLLMELIAAVIVAVALVAGKYVNIRGVYVLAFCVAVIVFSIDIGCFSRMLRVKPIMWFASIQFEFFIFHQAVIKTLGWWIDSYVYGCNFDKPQIYVALLIDNLFIFSAICILAIVYHKWMRQKCEAGMKRCLNVVLAEDLRNE